jgi:hypothetical protein
MKSGFVLFALAIAASLVMSACLDESTAPEVAMVQPGTTTRPLGTLQFQNFTDDNDNHVGEPFTYTACTMAREAGSVALVEFTGEGQLIPVHEDCTGPYSRDVFVMPSQVYGVAAGEALPAQVPLIYHDGIGYGHLPKVGDVWLVTVRQAEGQWFMVDAISAVLDVHGDLTATALPDDDKSNVELPSDFFALSESLTSKIDNLETLCPDEAKNRRSDDVFRDYSFDPTFRRGSNCHPDDGPQQQNSSEIDEEDLPSNGGTDDSIQP